MNSNYKLSTGGGLIKGAEPIDIITRYEQVATTICPTAAEGDVYVADLIAKTIRKKAEKGQNCVLALSTGKSPVGVYKELVKKHKHEGLSFKNVVVFTLDEFYPISCNDSQSRCRSVYENLLEGVDMCPENIHLMDAETPLSQISAYCKQYEEKIRETGGIDIALVGVGHQGQIAFNEQGTYINTKTRLVALSNNMKKLAASDFGGAEHVPSKAITMGIATILEARHVILIAWSEEKAAVVAQVIEGAKTTDVPASLLQGHKNCEMVISEDAAAELTRVKTPWLVGTCEWTHKFIRKAVLWLCQKTSKPILKLTYQDYINHGLSQLIEEKGEFSSINIKVFNDLQHTISGWPGGKPNADDSTRPERSTPFPKKVIIFSPHPDDDVISMGGTFLRLIDQGHDVHVAYQTSGNIAVLDDVVLQIVDTARECGFTDNKEYERVRTIIQSKKKGEIEPVELRQLKGAIRRAEAKAACRYLGLNDQTNVHFQNLPFYETGAVKKNGLGQEDIDLTVKLLRELKPQQIYAAGDLSDPHGTHRVCIEAVLGALEVIKAAGDQWLKDCRLWLYRGAWQEWGLDMADMAVPLSPDEVLKKRHAIFRHLSQKDAVPFPGEDKREFWQRSEDRTQATAQLYDKLGMAEYQAIEVFVRYDI